MMAGAPADDAALPALLDEALALQKQAVSRLISLFEDQRPSAVARRAAAMAALRARSPRRAVFIGVTGTPGSGKSTLVGRVALRLIELDPAAAIAVLAVDPSSRVSGGALLGDRTRTRFPPGERRLFFRSQAAEHELGGLGPSTFQVCRLLSCLYDFVFVETVGIGQSEADIRELADRVYLVLQPLAGDEVQFLKAGIMEVPHAFVVNKCDEPAAERSYHQLRGSLWLARPFDERPVPIFRTSARTGQGIDELAAALLAEAQAGDFAAREAHFFARWVREEWGRVGARFLDEELGGAAAWVAARGFDGAQLEFAARARDSGRG
jgi:LAO/AO transport system kinase